MGGLLGALGVGGYLFWLLRAGLLKDGNWIGVDFHVYYQVARVLSRGEDIYAAGISPPYVYPPLLAALVMPIAALPVDAATILWKLLQHLCLLVAGGLLVNLTPRSMRPLAGGLLLLGLLTVPVQDEIQVGESNSVILLLVVGAVWLVALSLDRDDKVPLPGTYLTGRPSTAAIGAGALLALAAGIKVLPVIVIAYLWLRGPRLVALVATIGFLLLQIIMLLLTPSTADYWITQFPSLFGQAFPFLDNQSLNATIARAITPGTDPIMPAMNLVSAEGARSILTWLANLAFFAGAVWTIWTVGRRPLAHDKDARRAQLLLEFGLVLLTIHLVSGSTWLHHFIDLALPLLGLLSSWWLARQNNLDAPAFNRSALLYGAALGLAYAALLNRPSDWLTATAAITGVSTPAALLIASLGTLVLIGLWAGVAVALLRTSSRTPERV